MTRLDTLSTDQRKDAFLNTLANIQGEFEKKGIEYRIIGSLATHAYLGPNLETVRPLDYDRKGAATPDQRVPDVDLIVPRYDLPEAREIRAKTLLGTLPVKIGLANPASDIDFRPNDTTSYLTHKDIVIPIESDVFRAEEDITLEGLPIQTIPLDTLIHTYGTFGGQVRQKDIPSLKALIRKSDAPSDPRTDAFHEFQKLRRIKSPGEHIFSLTKEAVSSKTPRRLNNELYRFALIGADMLGRR